VGTRWAAGRAGGSAPGACSARWSRACWTDWARLLSAGGGPAGLGWWAGLCWLRTIMQVIQQCPKARRHKKREDSKREDLELRRILSLPGIRNCGLLAHQASSLHLVVPWALVQSSRLMNVTASCGRSARGAVPTAFYVETVVQHADMRSSDCSGRVLYLCCLVAPCAKSRLHTMRKHLAHQFRSPCTAHSSLRCVMWGPHA